MQEAKKRRSRQPKKVPSTPCPPWTPIYGAKSKEAIEDRLQVCSTKSPYLNETSTDLGLGAGVLSSLLVDFGSSKDACRCARHLRRVLRADMQSNPE